MSKKGFYYYNGSVQKLPCSVQDHVFSDLMNRKRLNVLQV